MNTTPAKPTQNQGPVISEQKKLTKEELKVQQLMSKWPDYVRNPDPRDIELTLLKRQLENTYRFHQGDNPNQYSWNIPQMMNIDLESQLRMVMSTDSLIYILEGFEGFLNSYSLFEKFDSVCQTQDFTPEFYSVVIPIVKHHMKRFNRECIRELYFAVRGGAIAHLGDKEFWDIVDFKLVNERLYRYLSLEQAVNLAFYLGKADKGSSSLIKALEVHLIKHRKALFTQKKLVKKAKEAFGKSGSELLLAALNDPNIEVPGIDADIPVMTLRKETEKLPNERNILI